MSLFVKIMNELQPLTIFIKRFTLDILQGSVNTHLNFEHIQHTCLIYLSIALSYSRVDQVKFVVDRL